MYAPHSYKGKAIAQPAQQGIIATQSWIEIWGKVRCYLLKPIFYCLFAEIGKQALDFEAKASDGKIDGISQIVPENIVLFQCINRSVDDRVGVSGSE